MPPSIQDFAIRLLARLGATVMPDGSERVAVSIPPELAPRFDHREAFNLAFSPEAQIGGGSSELVIPGSYWLDRLLEIATERGQVSAVRLASHPSAEELGDGPPEGVIFRNASSRVRSRASLDWPYLLVHFKLTFLSDDIEEHLWPVWVDLVSGAVDTGSDGFTWWAVAEGTDVEDLLQRVESRVTLDAALELSRAAAEEEAARRAEEKDREIERRLHDEFVRLDEFYADLLKDLAEREERGRELDGETRTELRAERRRLKREKESRHQEALDKYQLKVVVRPINVAHIFAPELVQEIEVSDETSAGAISVHLDLVRGTARRPPCPDCDEPMAEVHLCRRGHLVCPTCAMTCVHCRQLFCTSCGVFPCPLCGRHTCPDCAAECEVCGKSACREHLVACEDTGQTACPQCATDCPACQRRYRETPLLRCALGEEQVCASCLVACAICGKGVCPDHLLECPVCGKPVCHGHVGECPRCLQHYCTACLPAEERCPTCQSLFPARQSRDAIVSLLTSAGLPAARFGDWRLAEDRCHFMLVGRRWWWRHLFVIDKATMGIVVSRRWFQMWGE